MPSTEVASSSTIYSGTGTPEALPWETNSLAYDAAKNSANGYDLEKAKSLLAQSGLSNLAFDLVTQTGVQETNSLAQLYQSSLAQLGITLTIKPYDTATYLDQINNHKYTGAYIGAIAYAAMEPVTRMANSRHLDPSGNSNTGIPVRSTCSCSTRRRRSQTLPSARRFTTR